MRTIDLAPCDICGRNAHAPSPNQNFQSDRTFCARALTTTTVADEVLFPLPRRRLALLIHTKAAAGPFRGEASRDPLTVPAASREAGPWTPHHKGGRFLWPTHRSGISPRVLAPVECVSFRWALKGPLAVSSAYPSARCVVPVRD